MTATASLRTLCLAIAAALLAALVLAPTPAAAINGHFLHGAGAANSAMGGAGVGLPTDALTALAFNPALLTELEGQEFQFSFELLDGSPSVSSSVQTPFGTVSGTTENDTGVLPIPAFGFSQNGEGRVAWGLGALGRAGYVTDYPQDPTNPVLAPQPVGFGRVNSEYNYLKIPVSVAWKVNDRLSLGVSFVAGYAQLSASAAPFAAPDCTGPADCWYPVANKEESYGYGAQVGLFYRASDRWSFGASYETEQKFEDFEFNSTVANPALPSFGTARSFEFSVDLPAQAAVGIGFRPTETLSIALDGRWIGYSSVDGFGTFGFNRDGSIRGFGWDDITVIALGAEWAPSERWALRAGYNYSDSPIVDERAAFTTAAPATFNDHLTLGLGLRMTENLMLDLAAYRAFENEVTGPILTPAGPIPGSTITQRNESDSLVTTLSFGF